MRNDARPIGEQFRDIAEHSDHGPQTSREPAERTRPSDVSREAEVRPTDHWHPSDTLPDQSDR